MNHTPPQATCANHCIGQRGGVYNFCVSGPCFPLLTITYSLKNLLSIVRKVENLPLEWKPGFTLREKAPPDWSPLSQLLAGGVDLRGRNSCRHYVLQSPKFSSSSCFSSCFSCKQACTCTGLTAHLHPSLSSPASCNQPHLTWTTLQGARCSPPAHLQPISHLPISLKFPYDMICTLCTPLYACICRVIVMQNRNDQH